MKHDGLFLYDTINRTLRSRNVAIGAFQEWKWTRCAPAGLHSWEQFIQLRELAAIMAAHESRHGGSAGMSPGANWIELARQIRRRKRGLISYVELGMRMSQDLSMSYMGWAFKR